MENYINELSMKCMMNKNCFIDNDSPKMSFYKTKNKKNIVVFHHRLPLEEEAKYDKIQYMYLTENPNNKSAYSEKDIFSIVDSSYLRCNLKGRKFKGLRHQINKYENNILCSKDVVKWYSEIIDFIDRWKKEYGITKYGFQERTGRDKNFFTKFINNIDDYSSKYVVNVFIDVINCKVVGYSVISKNPISTMDNIPVYSYPIGKSDNNYNSLTEYIDWYTFSSLITETQDKVIISWGCGGKSLNTGVGWYKTNKWDVYKLVDTWFMNVNNTF